MEFSYNNIFLLRNIVEEVWDGELRDFIIILSNTQMN